MFFMNSPAGPFICRPLWKSWHESSSDDVMTGPGLFMTGPGHS